MFRYVFIAALFSFQTNLYAQNEARTYIESVKKLPQLKNKVTVKGYGFEKTLFISKDSLQNGFELKLQDESYRIVAFILTYECESCDLWTKLIYGSTIAKNNFQPLRSLKKGETIGIELVKVEKQGKAFRVPSFMIVITE